MPGSFRSESMNLGLKLIVIQDRTLANFMSGRFSENGPIRLILMTFWCPGGRLEISWKVPGGTWKPFEGWLKNDLPKEIIGSNFGVPCWTLFELLTTPVEHHGDPRPQKVSSFKALDSGSDSGLDFRPSQMC